MTNRSTFNRSLFLSFILTFIILSGMLMVPGCRLVRKKPNIVFIFCDQMSPRAMGWTGQTEVKTPHLDDFSEMSYCFTNAYCTSPVCAPARHSIYTGVYPSRHWVLKNDMAMNEQYKTIIAMLNEQGYTTANIGKMHNAPYHNRRDFQYVLNHEFFVGPAGISHYDAYLRSELAKRGIKDYNPYRQVPKGKVWLQVKEGIAGVNPLPEDLIPEHWMTREALKFMDDQEANRPDQPFFLHLSYFPPHHPYMPVREYADLYLDHVDRLELPPNYDHEKLQAWCRASPMRPDSLSDEDVKYFRALYFGFVSQLDAALGDLFEGMKERGLIDNTIIVFTSDHGDNLGEHGKFYKGNMLEGSVRVPLMVYWPRHRLKGRRIIEDNVSHVDLVPTLLLAAGITPPEYMAGRNMMPLMKGKESWPDHSVYAEYYALGREPTQLMLRKGDFKLTYYLEPASGDWGNKFYNIREDPWEMKDLFNDPEYADILLEYVNELMNDYWQAMGEYAPPSMPEIVSRVSYDIEWPADPWEPVKINSGDKEVIKY